MPIVRVRDVMIEEVLSIEGMATAKEAAAMMRSNQVSELLVAKRTPDDAWGIVTVQDLAREVISQGQRPDEVFVYEIMTKPVVTVPADMDIRYAIRLLQHVGVHRAPADEKGEIVGMITLSNLVLGSDNLW
ncbi:CBS domain-containing protein [Desulfohalovibrio reitneri]|uniref:CBS domain-containing protein n=1 Tax=Desulfohalovibrio reitneri TaxID=1307759 RepID=UPI0004A775D8|nr:CBS domain-containing protein [Desulfohalovibrio reitneri]